MIDHWLIDECTLVATTRNKYGDFVYGTETTINCRFREINDITRGVDGREELDADAMLWVKQGSGVELNSIVTYNSQSYKVDTITNARRGGHTNIEFLKCLLVVQRQVS